MFWMGRRERVVPIVCEGGVDITDQARGVINSVYTYLSTELLAATEVHDRI